MLIITQEPLDRFASKFDLGTQENHVNVLSLVLRWVGVDLYRKKTQAKLGSQTSYFYINLYFLSGHSLMLVHDVITSSKALGKHPLYQVNFYKQ